MRSKTLLLSLVLLLSLSLASYSDEVSNDEITEILDQILTELETASTRQDMISAELGKAQATQSDITKTLETVQNERLPDISEDVTSLETSFRDYVRKEERDDAMLLGAAVAAVLLSVLALIF